jgi:glucose/mannose-6-phosphate isomerase
MPNLNDRAVVTELDPKGILKLTEGFPRQCREAFEIATRVEPPKLENRPGVVALAGMGGSGAGGDFVRALFEAHGGAPFIVSRDYSLPSYLGVGDVVFCASYSGNTEETLSAYESAKRSGARIVAVTSGGRLKEQADADGFTVYEVPGGQPPRTALGYMMIPVIVAAHRMKLIPDPEIEKAIALLETAAEQWGPEAEDNAAKALAREMEGALPILYGLGTWQGYIANRWRCQINENAKHLAFVNAYPELNHNEIMGWVGAGKQSVGRFVGVVLEDGTESERMATRAKVTEGLIKDTIEFHHVRAQGETLLEKMLMLAHFGDYVSVYLARLNGVDPEDISSINTLKDELAKI